MYEFKALSHEAIPAALEKAERYRLLNEPIDAESICHDVLAVDPNNEQALVMLVLSLTDQLVHDLADRFQDAREAVSRLQTEYDREYYSGIICERRAKAIHRRGRPGCGGVAFEWLEKAMQHYERAAELREPGNEDAYLRWNSCVRIINRHPDIQQAEHTRAPLDLE